MIDNKYSLFTWEKTNLERLGKLRFGSLYNRLVQASGGVKVNYVKQSILNGEFYVVKNVECFNREDLRDDDIFPPGTICINVDKFLTSILKESSYLQQSVIAFEPLKRVCDSRFIRYYFESTAFTSYFAQSKKENKVSIEKLLEIDFASPSLILQQKIGETISDYDLLINNYQNQVFLLEKIRSYLFQKYFENYQPLRFEKLKDLVFFKKGRNKVEDSDNEGSYLLFTYSALNKKTNYYCFDQEALIFCNHSDNKYIKYFCGKFGAFQEIYVLTVKPKLIIWLLESIKFILSSKNKRKENIWLHKFPVPEDSLLDLFSQFSTPIQKKINNLTCQIELLQKAKRDLIQEIYSQRIKIGQI